MSNSFSINRVPSNVSSPNSILPVQQANQDSAEALRTIVSLFKAISIPPQTPSRLSEAQLIEWERVFFNQFSEVLENDPHPALRMPNTPFSVWMTQELFLLVSSFGVKDELMIRLVPNLAMYLQTYPTLVAKSAKENPFLSGLAESRLDPVLSDIDNYLRRINPKLPGKKREKEQIIKIIKLLRHLETADTEVLKKIWFSDLNGLIPKTVTRCVEPNSSKQTANEIIRSLKVFATLFLDDASGMNFVSALKDSFDEMLNARTILNGNFECIERDVYFNDSFHELIQVCEEKFDLDENNPFFSLNASIAYAFRSFCISVCNLQRQFIVQEIVEKKCCGSLEEKMIVLLADRLFELFALLPEYLTTLSFLKDRAPNEWQFCQKLTSELQGVLNGSFNNSFDLLKKQHGSNEAMQGLLLGLFELEDTVGVYQKKLDSLETYQRYRTLFGTDALITDPRYVLLNLAPVPLKQFRCLIDCMWAVSRDKLPGIGVFSKRGQATAEALMKYFDLKSPSDQTAESGPSMQSGSLSSKSARNARKREKLKQKKKQAAALKATNVAQSLSSTPLSEVSETVTPALAAELPKEPVTPSEVSELGISKLEESDSASVKLEESEAKSNVAEDSKTAALVSSKKQQRRARQAKRADKEASMSPIQFLSTKALKKRSLFEFLSAEGWTESHQRGSHVIMKHSTLPGRISVPNHSTIDEGTAKALVGQIHKIQSGSGRYKH